MATVYLADRDVVYRQKIAGVLRDRGIRVVSFADGTDLYERTLEREPDLIVTDTDLAGLDGFQVFVRLQQQRAGKAFPLVFLTTFEHPGVAHFCKQEGALEYLGKSQPVEEIANAIEALLAERDPFYDSDLPAALRLLQVEAKSGLLDVTAYGEDGYVLLHRGMVLEARWNHFEGDEALRVLTEVPLEARFRFAEWTDELAVKHTVDLGHVLDLLHGEVATGALLSPTRIGQRGKDERRLLDPGELAVEGDVQEASEPPLELEKSPSPEGEREEDFLPAGQHLREWSPSLEEQTDGRIPPQEARTNGPIPPPEEETDGPIPPQEERTNGPNPLPEEQTNSPIPPPEEKPDGRILPSEEMIEVGPPAQFHPSHNGGAAKSDEAGRFPETGAEISANASSAAETSADSSADASDVTQAAADEKPVTRQIDGAPASQELPRRRRLVFHRSLRSLVLFGLVLLGFLAAATLFPRYMPAGLADILNFREDGADGSAARLQTTARTADRVQTRRPPAVTGAPPAGPLLSSPSQGKLPASSSASASRGERQGQTGSATRAQDVASKAPAEPEAPAVLGGQTKASDRAAATASVRPPGAAEGNPAKRDRPQGRQSAAESSGLQHPARLVQSSLLFKPEAELQSSRGRTMGTMILRIRIRPDGIAQRVRILKSSGYDAIDRAAIAATGKVVWRKARRTDGNGSEGVPEARWITQPIMFEVPDGRADARTRRVKPAGGSRGEEAVRSEGDPGAGISSPRVDRPGASPSASAMSPPGTPTSPPAVNTETDGAKRSAQPRSRNSPPLLREPLRFRYPTALSAKAISGSAVLRVLVGPSGKVEDAQLLRSSGEPELDSAALEAVRAAAYDPARRNGKPVPEWIEQPVLGLCCRTASAPR
jgi:TonB family protein